LAPWGTAGATNESDIVLDPSASVPVTGLGTYTFSSSNLLADVLLWLTNSNANKGWLLVSHTEAAYTARQFGTREDTVNFPRLTIEFIAPAQPLLFPFKGDGVMQIVFDVQAGFPYTLEFLDSFSTNGWVTVTNFPPESDNSFIIFDAPTTNRQGYYRVRTP